MKGLTPYWTEERGISLLADGYLGFVFRYDDMIREPSGRDIHSFQIIHNDFMEQPIGAVRTNIRVEYKGSMVKTFLSPSYAAETMRAIGERAMERVMSIKREVCGEGELLSAQEVASGVGRKRHFIYVSAYSGEVEDLIGEVDFSYARCGEQTAWIMNADHLVPAMALCHERRFWTVALPVKVFDRQMRFLSLPLGAISSLLSDLKLFSRSIQYA